MIKRFMDDDVLTRVQELKPIADELGLTMAQLAVAWVLQNDNVAAALVGASRPEQVHENVKAAGVEIPAEVMARIDEALGDVVERDPAQDRGERPAEAPRADVAALTQAEAVARRALLDVQSYVVDLDLSGAETEPTFGSSVTVRFTARADEATWVELKADEVLEAAAERRAGRPLGLPRRPAAAGRPRGAERPRAAGRYAYSRTGEGLHRYTDPEDGRVYLYARRSWTTRSACSPASTSPTSRRRSPSPSRRRPAGRCWATPRPPGRAGPLGVRDHRAALRPTCSPWSPGRTTACARSTTASRSASGRGSRWAPYLDAERLLDDTRRLRLLPRAVRRALPVRQVRPGVRPGVQRRRHGEPRAGHLPRRVLPPVAAP